MTRQLNCGQKNTAESRARDNNMERIDTHQALSPCLTNWYVPDAEPPWQLPATSPPQLRMYWMARLMSGPFAPRAILMRSASAEAAPWALPTTTSNKRVNTQHERKKKKKKKGDKRVQPAESTTHTHTHTHTVLPSFRPWTHQQLPQYCGMCWFRLLVRKFVPLTSPHEKSEGSVAASTYVCGSGEE